MAKKISEETFEIHYELGINHLLNAEPYKAVFCFQKSIMLNPKNLNAQIQLAISHELLDEPEISLMIYEKMALHLMVYPL